MPSLGGKSGFELSPLEESGECCMKQECLLMQPVGIYKLSVEWPVSLEME